MVTTSEIKKNKYDLERRTLEFAKLVIRLCKSLPKDNVNFVLIGQLVRSAGSIGANYREANESLSQKDFIHRLKISRKESKECMFWLELVTESDKDSQTEVQSLLKECQELRKILSSIITNSVKKNLD